MSANKRLQELEKTRLQIARKVRELRTRQHWTQEELAERLHVSQGYLSQLERGTGSFTAEQLLGILALFNVPATYFAPQMNTREQDLQNALARLGAPHLHESPDVIPREQLDEVASVVREALVSQSPRQITALAPVLVSNVDRINLRKLQLDLAEAGLERRLGWLIENTVAALREESPTQPPGPWRQPYRRAELVLGTFGDSLLDQLGRSAREAIPDILDPDILTPKTRDEVRDSASSISQRWGIVTGLQPSDFVDALRAARVDHR